MVINHWTKSWDEAVERIRIITSLSCRMSHHYWASLHLGRLTCWTKKWRWMENDLPFQVGDLMVICEFHVNFRACIILISPTGAQAWDRWTFLKVSMKTWTQGWKHPTKIHGWWTWKKRRKGKSSLKPNLDFLGFKMFNCGVFNTHLITFIPSLKLAVFAPESRVSFKRKSSSSKFIKFHGVLVSFREGMYDVFWWWPWKTRSVRKEIGLSDPFGEVRFVWKMCRFDW